MSAPPLFYTTPCAPLARWHLPRFAPLSYAFATEFRGAPVLCPHCQSESCRRSRRRGLKDLLFTLFALRPWRCRSCEDRFYAWTVAAVYFRHAHCPKCGNFDLQRISRDRVDEGYFLWPRRLLGFHAYRCDPCRTKFFSLRSLHRIVAVPSERMLSHSARTTRANVT